MEANKDAALHYIELAERAILANDNERALRYLNKSESLFPTEKAKGKTHRCVRPAHRVAFRPYRTFNAHELLFLLLLLHPSEVRRSTFVEQPFEQQRGIVNDQTEKQCERQRQSIVAIERLHTRRSRSRAKVNESKTRTSQIRANERFQNQNLQRSLRNSRCEQKRVGSGSEESLPKISPAGKRSIAGLSDRSNVWFQFHPDKCKAPGATDAFKGNSTPTFSSPSLRSFSHR